MFTGGSYTYNSLVAIRVTFVLAFGGGRDPQMVLCYFMNAGLVAGIL